MADARPSAVARRLAANVGRTVRRAVSRSGLPRRGGAWLLVRLSPRLEEVSTPHLPFTGPAPLSLLEVLSSLDAAATDPRVAGVLLRFSGPIAGMSRALSLRRAVDVLRERGVPVVSYGEVLDATSLVVASGAMRIFLPETGSLFLVGLRLEGLFLRRLLDRIEVRPEVLRAGTHKTAGEHLRRDRMSPEEREQLGALADDLYGELVRAVARGRGLEAEEVERKIDAGPYAARAAEQAGLIDGCLYPDEVEREMVALAPDSETEARDGRPRLIDAATYHARKVADPGWRPLLRETPRIAYVVGSGAIHRGRGLRGIACDSLRELLEQLRREEAVRGVVLRLDSPGGDAAASDLLWRAVSLLSREKPVVVSMGDVAASGGYFVAAAADAVLAEAGTVTGSIGVVGGKLDAAGLLERFGVHVDAVERGARAGLLSPARGFTSDERAALQGMIAAVYATFVDRVGRGRKLAPAELAQVAEGRVWSGARAQQLGLVDALGGPLEALREVRRRAGLAEGERYLLDLHPRPPALSGLLSRARWWPRSAGGW